MDMLSNRVFRYSIVCHNDVPVRRHLDFDSLAGLYLVVFGIVGIIQTAGESFAGDTGVRVLGQETNMLWSIISLILGAVIFIATGAVTACRGGTFCGWEPWAGWG